MSNITTFEAACRDTALQIAETVISKQYDYGHDNIFVFRERGLVVRLWDKVAKLKMLLWDREIFFNREEASEYVSIEDTFTDIARYAILGLILLNQLKDEEGE